MIRSGSSPSTAACACSAVAASVTSKPAEGQGLWSLSVPDWPGSEDAAFAEIWAVEGRISAWAGTCAVAEPAE